LTVELSGTCQFLVCADSVNILSKNINAIKMNTETVLDSSKEVSLEVNRGKIKHMVMARLQNAGQYSKYRPKYC
jgi:hypothetical protein